MIFVFGDGRERGDSLSPSLGKVEGRSGVGEEEASRGRIRDRVETREGGREDASAVHCSLCESRYHVAVPANYEAALAVGSSVDEQNGHFGHAVTRSSTAPTS